MIRAVIFDMDGTLVDSEPLHQKSVYRLLVKLGLPVAENMARAHGIAKRLFWQTMVAEYALPYTSDELTVLEFQELIAIIEEEGVAKTEDVEELLSALYARKTPMAVATSSDREYTDHILRRMGWEQYFSVVVCGNEVAQPKPAPDVYLKALEKLGVKREETIAVEDSYTGSNAARNAGLRCVGYAAEKVVAKQDLSACSNIVRSLIDVLPIISE